MPTFPNFKLSTLNGPTDQELNVPGYEHMDINRIKETARSRWDDKLWCASFIHD
jgi:hypothetical protein